MSNGIIQLIQKQTVYLKANQSWGGDYVNGGNQEVNRKTYVNINSGSSAVFLRHGFTFIL